MLLKSNWGHDSLSTSSLLLKLKKDGIISEKGFNAKLIKMISLNYHHVIINTETLKHAVESVNFYSSKKVLKTFNSLRNENIPKENLIQMSLKFFKWLWLENIPLEYKEKWTNIMLNIITVSNKSDKREIINIINDEKENLFSPLDPIHGEQFEKALNSWVAAQGII